MVNHTQLVVIENQLECVCDIDGYVWCDDIAYIHVNTDVYCVGTNGENDQHSCDMMN